MRENFADTAVSSTPILDRQAQLPALTAHGLGADHLIGLGIIVVVVITTALSLQHATSVPFWRQHLTAIFPELFPARWTVAKMASLGLMAFLVAFAVVAVHEIGHVLGGLCAGFRFNSLRIGPLMIHPGFRISRCRGWSAWLGGAAQMIPVASDKLAARAWRSCCAGPAASILSGCAVLLLPTKGSAAWLFAIGSLIGGLADLVPWRTPTVVSDGARIWMLLKRRGGANAGSRY